MKTDCFLNPKNYFTPQSDFFMTPSDSVMAPSDSVMAPSNFFRLLNYFIMDLRDFFLLQECLMNTLG